MELYVIRGGKLSSFGGFAQTDVGTEDMYIVGAVKFVVGNSVKVPAEKTPDFDFE